MRRMRAKICNVALIKSCIELELGDVTLFVGPNASGKSTIMRSIYALTKGSRDDALKVIFNTIEPVKATNVEIEVEDERLGRSYLGESFERLNAVASYASATRPNVFSLASLISSIKSSISQLRGVLGLLADVGQADQSAISIILSMAKSTLTSAQLYYLQQLLNPLDLELSQKIIALMDDERKKSELRSYLNVFKYVEDPTDKDVSSIAARSAGSLYLYPLLVAVLTSRDMLFVDEPETHLEIPNQAILVKLLSDKAKKGLKVVASTHSEPFVSALASYASEIGLDVVVYETTLEEGKVRVHERRLERGTIPIQRIEEWLQKIYWEEWWSEI